MAESPSLISYQNLYPTPYTSISTTNPGVSKAMSHSQQDSKTASCSPVQVFKRLVNKKIQRGTIQRAGMAGFQSSLELYDMTVGKSSYFLNATTK